MLRQFKAGILNVLVSTSIGEEGLDIGEVDRIICYDSSKTPIRMVDIVSSLLTGCFGNRFPRCKDLVEQGENVPATFMF